MVNILCALKAEAEPIVDHFRLKQIRRRSPYRLFENHDIQLRISGVGKHCMAAAARSLFAHQTDRPGAGWLNLGIAGHATLPLGSICLATKVTDGTGGDSWFPPQIYRWAHHRREIVTVEQPESNYPSQALYGMEAASFVAT